MDSIIELVSAGGSSDQWILSSNWYLLEVAQIRRYQHWFSWKMNKRILVRPEAKQNAEDEIKFRTKFF